MCVEEGSRTFERQFGIIRQMVADEYMYSTYVGTEW